MADRLLTGARRFGISEQSELPLLAFLVQKGMTMDHLEEFSRNKYRGAMGAIMGNTPTLNYNDVFECLEQLNQPKAH